MEAVSACIFVYDATNQKSFEAIKKLYEEMSQYFIDGKCHGNF
jgi:hypothetical protein